MSKRIKNLSVLTVAVIAGLFVTLSSLQIQASQSSLNNNDVVTFLDENAAISVIANYVIGDDNKCGEGKCGEGKCGEGKNAESKKETKVEKEGAAKVATPESKCGEGKCGSAEKKEGKAEKKESKTEKKAEEKCGTGKCGVA